MRNRICPSLLVATLFLTAVGRAAPLQDEESTAAVRLLEEAERWLAAGDAERAEELLGAAAELLPAEPRVLALRGQARFHLRRYLAAEADLERSLELGGQDPQTLFYLGSARWENGDPDGARELLQRAVAAGGGLAARYQLGRLLLWEGRYGEAVAVLQRAASRSPGAPEIQADLARALQGAGRPREALAAFRRAVELAPGDQRARYGLAMVLLRLEEREAAAQELAVYHSLYEEALEQTRQEELLQSRIDRGYDLLRRGEIDEALRHLRGLQPTADVWAARADAHLAAGDLDQALEALERAVAAAPERADLRVRLADLRGRAEGEP